MEIYAVKINGLDHPMGFDFEHLLCSWKVRNNKGKKQTRAKIQVAKDEKMSEVIWEKEGGLNSLGTVIEFSMKPYTRYYFQITVHSDVGEESKSDVLYFETAKLEDPWTAKWLGVRGEDTHPEFRKNFSIKKEIKSARLYICGLGIFETYLGGKKVGNDLLAPFINDYEEHYQYCTYDVTELLDTENKIEITVGNGWYKGILGFYCMPNQYGTGGNICRASCGI